MGTWGSGLFDNDGALDAVGEACTWIWPQLSEVAAQEASAQGAGAVAALVGLVLHFNDYSISSGDDLERIEPAIAAQRPAFEALPGRAVEVLEIIAKGEGKSLTERRGERSEALQKPLGGYLNHHHEPALFEQPASKAIAQRFAEHVADGVDGELGSADDEPLDIYEIWDGLGYFGLLLLIEPASIPNARVIAWRNRAEQCYTAAVEQYGTDGDMPFFEEAMERARAGFALAQARWPT